MKDDLYLLIYESNISKYFLLTLKNIFLEHPGETKVVLKVVNDIEDFSHKFVQLKRIKVDPSIDLLLQVMHLL